MVDAARVILEVQVHGEGRLHGATGHDSLLDALLTRRRDGLPLVSVLVLREIVVGGLGSCVALARARRRRLALAAWLALCRVWIVTLGSMVMAMRQREVAAQSSPKWACA